MKLGNRFVDVGHIDMSIKSSSITVNGLIRALDSTFDGYYAKRLRNANGKLVLDLGIGEQGFDGWFECGEVHVHGRGGDISEIYSRIVLRDDPPEDLMAETCDARRRFEDWRERMLATMF